jgi:outer membrane protein assembly factor BamB
MLRFVGLLWAVTCLGATGCQADGGAPPVSLTHASVLAKAGLQSFWEMQLQLQPGQAVERVWLIEENLYCLTNDNYLLAVDATRGVRKWARRVADPGVKVFPPCHGNGVGLTKEIPDVRKITRHDVPEALPQFNLVFINTPGYVLAFERDSGELLRKISFDTRPDQFAANTGGACDGRFFYVGSVNGRCYCYRVHETVIGWIMPTSETLTAAPQCHAPGGSPRVYIAGENGEYFIAKSGPPLSDLWPPDGTRQWPDMAGPVITEFRVDDRAVFMPCANRRVYAFPLGGGPSLWRFTCDGLLKDPLQLSENSVFQYASGDKLYAINPANGKQRWAIPAGRRVLATMSREDMPLAYVVDAERNLLVVDEILGKVVASIPLTGVDLFADNTAAPAIYMANRGGALYCLRQLGAGQLTTDMLLKFKPKGKGKTPGGGTTSAPTSGPTSGPTSEPSTTVMPTAPTVSVTPSSGPAATPKVTPTPRVKPTPTPKVTPPPTPKPTPTPKPKGPVKAGAAPAGDIKPPADDSDRKE